MAIKHPARHDATLYLSLIWHQHQPFYLRSETDQLQAPWVRIHGTREYYGMAALLEEYPDIHCTVNLSPVLLLQLQEYYVKRLEPFLDSNKRLMPLGCLPRRIPRHNRPLARSPAKRYRFVRWDRSFLPFREFMECLRGE